MSFLDFSQEMTLVGLIGIWWIAVQNGGTFRYWKFGFSVEGGTVDDFDIVVKTDEGNRHRKRFSGSLAETVVGKDDHRVIYRWFWRCIEDAAGFQISFSKKQQVKDTETLCIFQWEIQSNRKLVWDFWESFRHIISRWIHEKQCRSSSQLLLKESIGIEEVVGRRIQWIMIIDLEKEDSSFPVSKKSKLMFALPVWWCFLGLSSLMPDKLHYVSHNNIWVSKREKDVRSRLGTFFHISESDDRFSKKRRFLPVSQTHLIRLKALWLQNIIFSFNVDAM